MRRLPAIDAARGAAMVLVCVSHFAVQYIAPAGGDLPGSWLQFVAHTASPMFVIISGAMVGYLFAARPEAFDRVRGTLAKRALFLLTIGHVLILFSRARGWVDITGSGRMLFITDTIALALLVSPRLLRIPARYRLTGAVVVYAVNCALVYLWHPHILFVSIAKDTFIGPDGVGFWSYNVPVIPWLAVHAAGTVLGVRLAQSLSGDGHRRFETQLATAGAGIAVTGLGIRTLCHTLIAHVMTPGGRAAQVALQLSSPWQRVPPSPAHMLLFCGTALLGISAVFTVQRLGVFTGVLDWLSVLGRTSAFVFILQFYVFYVIVPALIPIHIALSPIVFLGAMLAIGQVARFWLQHRSRLTRGWWLVGSSAPTPVVGSTR